MNSDTRAATAIHQEINEKQQQMSAPAWGSYIYSNFLLPTISPNLASQWLTSPFNLADSNVPPSDYFGGQWQFGLRNPAHDGHKSLLPALGQGASEGLRPSTANDNGNDDAAMDANATATAMAFDPAAQHILAAAATALAAQHTLAAQGMPSQSNTAQSDAAPASATATATATSTTAAPYAFAHPYFYPSAIPTALLSSTYPNHQNKKPVPSTLDVSDIEPPHQPWSRTFNLADISPVSMLGIEEFAVSPSPVASSSRLPTPQTSPKRQKRRLASMDSEADELDQEQDEANPEVPEGVERDGMIWGLRVEDYRALSARERKRVRNRISARTFRAKRKEHLNSLENTLTSKDTLLKNARDDASRLRVEVDNLKRRLAKYEKV